MNTVRITVIKRHDHVEMIVRNRVVHSPVLSS